MTPRSSSGLGSSGLPVSACEVVAGGMDHPECVAVGAGGELYAGGEAGDIYRAVPGGEVEVMAKMEGESGGIALDSAGNLYECNMAGVVNRIEPSGSSEAISSGTPEMPMEIPNYAVFDPDGNLFVSDSGDWDLCSGRIYVIRPSGETELAFPDYLAFPNGMALDSENGWLYVVQSNVRNVIRLKVADGEIVGRAEIYVPLPAVGLADGVALAESGNLYVACFEPSAILKVRPDRHVEVVMEELLLGVFNRPTNVAFSREQPDLYYANYGGREIGLIHVGEAGMPLAYPELSGR
jgi:gluconolactonase